ncbi:MAG: glycosyltransferase [Pseudomonadota bacterium]
MSSFDDPRIIVYTNSANIGQTKSLNVGLKLAKGRYVIINDADDLSLPTRIEKQLEFIMNHPDFVAVGTSSYIMDRAGNTRRSFLKPTDPRVILLSVFSDTPIIHGSVIIDKQAVLSVGGYNEQFRICQDYELWSSLIRNGKNIANIPDILVVIRHYMDSVSFREKDAQTLENGIIMLANITAMTSLRISLDEAIRQRIFFTSPERLDEDAFFAAEKMFITEYECLNNRHIFDDRLIENDLKKRMIKPYCKLALSKIRAGRMKEARKITSLFAAKYGFSVMPFVIGKVSHTGRTVATGILNYYEKYQKLSVDWIRYLHGAYDNKRCS